MSSLTAARADQQGRGRHDHIDRMALVGALLSYAFVLRLSYTTVISPVWAYLGFAASPIQDPLVVVLSLIAVLLPGFALPLRATRPSAILTLAYTLFLHVPLAITAPLQRAAEGDEQGRLLALLFISSGFVLLAGRLGRLQLLQVTRLRLTEGSTYRFALIVAVVGTAVVLALSGQNLELSPLADVTTQRLAVRELVAGSPLRQFGAYVSNGLAFGVVPFLLVQGLARRRITAIILALGIGIVCYAATASRAYLAASLLAVLAFLWQKRGGLIDWRTVGVVSSIPGLALIVDWLQYAPVPLLHWVLYRNYFTPASVTNDYLNFFSTNPVTNFGTFPIVRIFIDSPYDTSIARVVAVAKTGNVNLNLNGSFLTTGIESAGLVGVVLVGVVTLCLFYLVDALAHGVDRVMLASLAGHSITITNIPVHVAVVSGGLAVSALLLFLQGNERSRGSQPRST